MLARRFTIVCLLVTIFGMSLAILVAEKSRPTSSWSRGMLPCALDDSGRCVSFTR